MSEPPPHNSAQSSPPGLEAVRTIINNAMHTAKPEEPRARLILNAERGVKSCLANVITILGGQPVAEIALDRNPWEGVLAYDEFACRVVARVRPPWPDDHGDALPRPWRDVDDTYAANWLQQLGVMVAPKVVGQAVQAVAERSRFHPVRDYLAALAWDGIGRLDHWLCDHLGVAEF